MQELNELIRKIDELRRYLESLIEQRETFDDEILGVSKIIDKMLNEYYELLKKSNNK